MAFCHGQGTTDPGGCCYVDGVVCPHHRSAAELAAWIDSLGLTGQRRTRALNMAQGVQHACGIALRLIAADPSLINDRTALNAAWNSHPDYVRDVRPAWVKVEQAGGMAAGSYQCSTWGPASAQCCFSELTATNEAKATVLHSTAVTVRRSGGG